MRSRRVLVVEDSSTIAEVLCQNLLFDGFVVACAADGQQALEKAAAFEPDAVLLDLALPDIDGLSVCASIRATQPNTAIIILTARTDHADKVRGLKLGADDYITKPFSLEELLARVHAVLRRTHPRVDRVALGPVLIDFAGQRATVDGRDLSMTPRELRALWYLIEHRGTLVTREELLRAVWGYSDGTLTRAVDTCVARLRRKVEADPHHPQYLRTVHGEGYMLVVPAEPGSAEHRDAEGLR
jgi:DNA-binding response OmpR family regulator